MGNSLAGGYRWAAVTLAVELLLALFLVSDTFGIFAIMAMPLVGIAWLPAAFMIVRDIRQGGSGSGPTGYLIATACGIIGLACLYVFARWTILSLAVT